MGTIWRAQIAKREAVMPGGWLCERAVNEADWREAIDPEAVREALGTIVGSRLRGGLPLARAKPVHLRWRSPDGGSG